MSSIKKNQAKLKKEKLVNLPTEDVKVYNQDCQPYGYLDEQTLFLKETPTQSIRIFTSEECQKLSKASYQFLIRLIQMEVIASETIEIIINQLLFSDSRFVSLQETKSVIRNALMDDLSHHQLAFLDLLLYQKEDGVLLN